MVYTHGACKPAHEHTQRRECGARSLSTYPNRKCMV